MKKAMKGSKTDNGPQLERALKKAAKHRKINKIAVVIRPGLIVYVDKPEKVELMRKRYSDK